VGRGGGGAGRGDAPGRTVASRGDQLRGLAGLARNRRGFLRAVSRQESTAKQGGPMSYETDALKREVERLRLEFSLEKGEHERTSRSASESRNALENARREIAGLQEADQRMTDRVSELENQVETLEAAMPSSTAELLALASTRLTELLGLLAHDEATTIAKLEAITEKLPNRTISTGGSPYLTRWYLWPEGPRTTEDVDPEQDPESSLPFALFLHKFHRGDADRDQHSHPWDLSVAIVLAGGYREERGPETRTYVPGMINVIRGDDFHRVDLLNPAMGSWSLFVAGRKTGGWGFKDAASGIVTPWQTYLASKAMRQ
jgi:hypothetical protein